MARAAPITKPARAPATKATGKRRCRVCNKILHDRDSYSRFTCWGCFAKKNGKV